MDKSNFLWTLLYIFIILTILFFIEKFIEKKIRSSNGTKWRLSYGIAQFIIALFAFIWIKGHSTILIKELYITVLIGAIILAIVGLGDIFIGTFNNKAYRLKPSPWSSLLQLIYEGASIWIITVLLALIAYFVWTLDRGFEISDESYYVLLAIYPSAVKLYISAQHWLTFALWSITGTLFGFRAIGLGILLFTAAILAHGVIHAYTLTSLTGTFHRREKAIIFACTLTGALLYGATINFSPCYNLLASSASYTAVGLVLLTIGRTSNRRLNALYFLAGCAIGIVLLNKASAGIAILSLIIALIAFLGGAIRRRVSGIVQIIFGMIAFVVLISYSHFTTSNVLEELTFGMSVFKSVQVESTNVRLLRYWHEFFAQIRWSGVMFVIPIAYLSTHTKSRNFSLCTGVALLCVVLLRYFYLPDVFTASRWLSASASLSTILALSLISTVPIWTKDIKAVALTIGLSILPYCVAFGTGNGIHTQIVASLASWGTVIAILAIATNSKGHHNSIAMIICAAFVYVIAYQVVDSGSRPYNLNSPIWEQNIPTKIGLIGTVKIDKATHEFVSTLTDAAQNSNIANNRPFLGFYNLPGVALVIQGIPVFSPWLTNAKQSEVMLSRVTPDILRTAVIGINGSRQLPIQFSSFPAGYKKCGEATYPYANQHIQLWVPAQ